MQSAAATSAGRLFVRRSPNAFMPTQRTPATAGYDLRCPTDILIEPCDVDIISVGLGLELPHGCVGLIAPCSDWSIWDRLDVLHDVVDTTSCENLAITVRNNSDRPLEISRGERVGQIVFVRTHSALLLL
jgi:dUTP pyrophosphatase